MPSEPSIFYAAMLSPSQLVALLEGLAKFPAAVRQRGQQYAAGGRVGAILFDGACAQAQVRGSHVYETRWEWRADTWRSRCSCPQETQCKHAYAVGQAMLGSTRSPLMEPARPYAAPRTVAPAAARVQGTVPREPLLRREMPSRVGSNRPRHGIGDPIAVLRASRDFFVRHDVVAQLLEDGPPPVAGIDRAVLDPIVRERDADVMCWRLAQAILAVTPTWMPPALEPYRDRDDLRTRATERNLERLENDLAVWGRRRLLVPKRRVRALLRLERSRDGGAAVFAEVRLTTARLNDAPRTFEQLRQLRGELRREQAAFPAEQAALLDMLIEAAVGAVNRYGLAAAHPGELKGAALRSVLACAANSPLLCWAESGDAELRRLAGAEPGSEVRFGRAAASLLPACLKSDDEARIELAFQWPDGVVVRLAEALYLRAAHGYGPVETSFVVAGGAFHVVGEEPPNAVLESFREAGGLPLSDRTRGHVLGYLAQAFPHVSETVEANSRRLAARPIVGLDLRADDWLQVRVFGDTGAGGWHPGEPLVPGIPCFELDPEAGWLELSAGDAEARRPGEEEGYAALAGAAEEGSGPGAEPRPGGGPDPAGPESGRASEAARASWFVIPDPERVRPAVDWVRSLPLLPGTQATRSAGEPPWADKDKGFWMHLGPRRLRELLEAWAQRPADVTFFGTDRLRRLLAGGVRVRPRVRIAASGVDWFAVSTAWEAEGKELSEADLATLRRAQGRFVKLSTGWVDRENLEEGVDAESLLADLGIDLGRDGEGAAPGDEQRIGIWQLAGARAESLDALAQFGADPETIDAARALRRRVAEFRGLPSIDVPAGLGAELRPYQRRGLDFLACLSSMGVGGVLADDMGLGKTVQALAWVLHLRQLEPDGGPSLVVCPASVVHNWQREAERFAPSLRVLLLGSGQSRHDARGSIADHDVVVTNYALLRRDAEHWREIPLRAAILDEAQNIKNPDAAVTRAAAALRARYRLALTGTPLENRALDLWSIVNFANPGYLGLRSRFQQRYDRPEAPPHLRTLLAAKLRPVLLRRTKREVAAELPERIEERQDCELTTEQRHLYLAELRRSRKLVEELSAAPGGIAKNKVHVLAALTRLRQICCHPALAGGKADAQSGKFEALFELLEPLLAEGHKVLVFSQFVACLRLLHAELAARAVRSHMLTGQSKNRGQIVDAFQNDPDPCVFLISLRAGGTGLNLTAATYVILFDPWWNPAVEAQAIDRTHRIGQDKTVIAYRMLARGTIEEKIYELQQRKAALVRDILGEGGFARALSREDLDFLLAET